jgi:hypothetical protein
MHLIVEYDGRSFYSESIAAPQDLQMTFSGAAFPCLLWDHAGGSHVSTKEALARALIRAGCRYAVCAGRECEQWHDMFDECLVEDRLDSANKNEDALVMTTWHDGETPDDVASFFVFDTNFGPHDFKHFLVLHFGTGPQKFDVDESIRRYAIH